MAFAEGSKYNDFAPEDLYACFCVDTCVHPDPTLNFCCFDACEVCGINCPSPPPSPPSPPSLPPPSPPPMTFRRDKLRDVFGASPCCDSDEAGCLVSTPDADGGGTSHFRVDVFESAWAANGCCTEDCVVHLETLVDTDCSALSLSTCSDRPLCVQGPKLDVGGPGVHGMGCTVCENITASVAAGVVASCEDVVGCFTSEDGFCDHCAVHVPDAASPSCPSGSHCKLDPYTKLCLADN